jgi:plasmid stabilization system protein ParE
MLAVVHWLEPASLDRIEIVEFVSPDCPVGARQLGRTILRADKQLSRQPRRGTVVPQLQEQGISAIRRIFVGI